MALLSATRWVLWQQDLPLLLRVPVLVPLTIHFIAVGGIFFALPPGPLCDEGMVLFMEGGCDMGESNIFFFSKLGVLFSVTFALVYASLNPPGRFRSYLPHLAILVAIGWIHRSGGRCDTYYGHPNGSIGQMSLEVAAFSVLGISMLPLIRGRGSRTVLCAVTLWHLAYIGSFYAWLHATDHWTWLHTCLICTTLLIAAAAIRFASPSPPRAAQSPVARTV